MAGPLSALRLAALQCWALGLPWAGAAPRAAAAASGWGHDPAYAEFLDHLDRLGLAGQRPGEDAATLRLRAGLFRERSARAAAHNADGRARWRAAVNQFSDHTEAELRARLGYRRGGDRPGRSASLRTVRRRAHRGAAGAPLPDAVSWTGRLASANFTRDQGNCGSCWAAAAVGALETHAELAHGRAGPLSHDMLVRCTRNPRKCGGSGGCDGATAELAFEYATQYGVADEADLATWQSCDGGSKPRVVAQGYVQLPMNEARPLRHALSTEGPVVVSVEANDWFMYGGGIFDKCQIDAEVDHAVLLVGYGHEAGSLYWQIRNSWGYSWGERGHLRLLRLGDEGDDAHCGTDRSPQLGAWCEGGPGEVRVCGTCGILSDSVYPRGVRLVDVAGSSL